MKPLRRLAPATILLLLLACDSAAQDSTPPAQSVEGVDRDLFQRMLAAEDGRVQADEQLAPLREGLTNADPVLRRTAVRALGRFERSALMREIVPLLEDPDADVRAEAANALGQAARGGEAGFARNSLHARYANETDPRVRGVIAETLGRLPHESATEAEATATTLSAIASNGGAEAQAAHLGAARGFFFLTRQPTGRQALTEPALQALRSLLVYGLNDDQAMDTLSARRTRSVAAAALFASGRAVTRDYETAAADANALVRREAAAAIGSLQDGAREAILERLLEDPSPMVRYDALRVHVRVGRNACPAITAAITDSVPADADEAGVGSIHHVRLLAIDAAAQCAGTGIDVVLDSIARTLPASNEGWHDAAHAVATLAVIAPSRARPLLDSFATHGSFFVRTWAATAAQRLQDAAALTRLAADAHPNVRTAAVSGLVELRGHAADSVYIAQLESDDSQLIQTAAGALAGSTHPGTIDALLASLDRFSARGRETERDARIALLERIAELGGPANAAALDTRLSDYDPAVANRAAEILSNWTGTPRTTSPMQPPNPLTLPTLDELEDLARRHVIIAMESGDTIEIALRPFDAPTNTARFARLARQGYFDGLTFHRVAPNFVIQGGSPNANEYAGDGPFSRDELVTQANWRGTVGLSTRGRDTGDGQIFVNLIDNVRLDHDYTVFGEVVRGLGVVDGILEGAVMQSVMVR